MKRFWWDEKREQILWDRGQSDCVLRSDESGMFETDYRGAEPREIQSAEYNPETGRIKLVPKEPVRGKTLREAAEEMCESFNKLSPGQIGHSYTDDPVYHRCSLAHDALEEALANEQPANPYGKAEVDELLDASDAILGAFPYSQNEVQFRAISRLFAAIASLRSEAAEKAGA